MTVCIAAVCDGGNAIVVAADRMFTAGAPINLEFETAEKKIEALSPSCVALLAGNSAFGTEILQGALATLQGAQRPELIIAAEAVKDSYVAVRGQKVRDTVLIPFLGPDFVRAEQLGSTVPQYLQAQAAVYQNIIITMNQFNLGSDIIVAGVDDHGGRLAVIGHPGTIAWFDKLGYAAIGSGGIHATMRLSLGAQTRNSPLGETL
jgi:20S proteasome alpha/beta subunit